MGKLNFAAKVFFVICGILALSLMSAVVIERFSIASSDVAPIPKPEQEISEPIDASQDAEGVFQAEIEYVYDVSDAANYLLRVRVYPGETFPGITGGYIETTIVCKVSLRGVSVPTACDTAASRIGRPIQEVHLERSRWTASIDYTWSIVGPHKKLRLLNPVLLDDGRIQADLQFFLGGAWHDLSTALVQDEHAREHLAGIKWNWGSLNVRPIPQ